MIYSNRRCLRFLLEIDSPTRALSEVLRNREMLADDNVTATAAAATAAADVTSIAKSILTASEAPWASFFTGGLTAAKLEKVRDLLLTRECVK